MPTLIESLFECAWIAQCAYNERLKVNSPSDYLVVREHARYDALRDVIATAGLLPKFTEYCRTQRVKERE